MIFLTYLINIIKQKIFLPIQLIFYNKFYHIKTPSKHLKDATFFKFDNVKLNIYSGLIWSNGKLVEASLFNKKGKRSKSLFQIPYEKITKSSQTITTIHHGHWDNFYHWYIDSLPRVWFFWDQNIQRIDQIELYIFRNLSDEEKLLIRNLLPENITIKIIEENQLVCSNHGIIPPFYSKDCNGELPRPYLTHFLDTAVNTFNLKCSPKNEPVRLFISRSSAKTRRFINQVEVESYFKAKEFKVLRLEEYKISEQAHFFYNADVIVAQHGAGLTNLLYSRFDKCKVIEIFHSMNNHLHHYRGLAKAKNISYTPIFLNGKTKNEAVIFDYWNHPDLLQI